MQPTETGAEPKSITFPVAGLLATTAGLLRLAPHPWNFSPTYGMEVFSGARLHSWKAFALPLAIRFATDLLLLPAYGLVTYLSDFWSWPFVYASTVINILLVMTLRRTRSPWRIAAVSMLASEQFFLITNFGTWLGSNFYPHTLPGLIQCYAMGIPFFGGTLLSSLAYCGILFGAHALLTRKQPVAVPAGLAAEAS